MWFRRFDAQVSHGWQHVILVGVSLSFAYLIAFLTFMNQWINFWLRGSYYLSYQAIFLTLLLVLFLVRLSRHHTGQQLPGISLIMFGGAAGYVAGLIAFLLHPIFQENGVHQVLATLQFPAREAVIAFLWFPVRLLSWLFGAITGILIVVFSRWFRTRCLGPT
jgi:predicted neutral ceramidase superfamily lipid hydrolase